MNTLAKYILGFLFSLGLTGAAFWLVQVHIDSSGAFLAPHILIGALVSLALVQLVVQAVCFLHVGAGKHAAWNVVVLSFTFFVVAVVAGGSLWIMNHLNHQVHTAEDIFESEAIIPHGAHD